MADVHGFDNCLVLSGTLAEAGIVSGILDEDMIETDAIQ